MLSTILTIGLVVFAVILGVLIYKQKAENNKADHRQDNSNLDKSEQVAEMMSVAEQLEPNKLIDTITRIDQYKFSFLMVSEEEKSVPTNVNLSEDPEKVNQMLLTHPYIDYLKNEKSLFKLDHLVILIRRMIFIKLKNINTTISYRELLMEVKTYLDQSNGLLEGLDKATSNFSSNYDNF